MINGKSRVLKRLDDRSVGVSQLCVFSNQGYSHVFQETIRSEMRCSSNYLIALKKEHFRVEHFHTCQPSLSTLLAFSWDLSSQTCSNACRSSSQPPVLPARGVLCKWKRRPGHRSPKNDNKRYSFSHSKKLHWTIFTLWSRALKYFTCEGSTWQNIEIFSFTTVCRGVEQRHIIWSQSGQCCYPGKGVLDVILKLKGCRSN